MTGGPTAARRARSLGDGEWTVTGRGWGIGTAAVASIILGRLLGLEDLFLLGVGLLLVIAVGALYVRTVQPRAAATRRVLPSRVHAGASSRVELTLTNRSPRSSPVLSVRDPFDNGARWARFLVAPLLPGETARAAYRLPTGERGVFGLGPLQIGVSDPFGLISVDVDVVPRSRLTVYPRIDAVAPPPSSHGDDPLAGPDHPRGLSGGGEDFYALRPYVRGDDLRRVHWPSTAKADDLMIRQEEMPWQTRSTVLLDTRPEVGPSDAFEILVSAAASLVVSVAHHDGLQRLTTTDGYDSRSVGGMSHVNTILEHLAGIGRRPGDLIPVLGSISRSQAGGALVILTTALAPASDFRAIAGLRGRFASVTLVIVERSAWGDRSSAVAPPTGVPTVRVDNAQPFAVAWATLAGPPGARTGRRSATGARRPRAGTT